MSSPGLVAQPLQGTGAFNWIYLIDWIVVGVLSLFFLFYFNRLFSTVVIYFVRLYTWRAFGVYIDIEALQISPLAGRIFFKGVRYHGNNETILVHSGQITWRYWLPKTKTAQIFLDDSKIPAASASISSATTERSGATVNRKKDVGDFGIHNSTPCRTHIRVSGVEAFVYNRSPGYDLILESISHRDPKNGASKKQTVAASVAEKTGFISLDGKVTGSSTSDSASSDEHHGEHRHSARRNDNDLESVPSVDATSSWDGHDPAERSVEPPGFLRLFPVRVDCTKAAAVLGNPNSKAIVTAKVDSAFGEFDAGKAGPFDIFKILMSFEVTHPYVQMKPNVDFKAPQLSEAANIKRESTEPVSEDRKAERKFRRAKLSQMFNFLPFSRSMDSVAIKQHMSGTWNSLPFVSLNSPAQEQWQGLARYLDDSQHDEHDEWGDVEYAKSSVIADIGKVGFQFYWDIGGSVPPERVRHGSHTSSATEQINGSDPPEYGMKLIIHGGQVNYGPWADRHRIVLQQIFFPAIFVDPVPFPPLSPGQTRLCTQFKLDLEVREEVVLRIPFREPSKDSKWKGKAVALQRQGKASTPHGKKSRSRKGSTRHRGRSHGLTGSEARPFAWYDIKVKAASFIHYDMDMFACKTGYRKGLGLHVSSLEISSSLNHALMWRSQAVSLRADLSDPLSWNGLRKWVFDINISRLDLFLLRDHTFLLVDLIEDWSKGPLPDFYTFVPYQYILNVHFQDFKLYLNTNDANIIDNSEDLEDNEFVILYGRSLDSNLAIPLDRFRPSGMTITFDVHAEDLGFELRMPPKNTINELLVNKDVAQLASVDLTGAYRNCSEVRPGLTETMTMKITGRGLNIAFFGFLARQLAKIKENYFGETVHFRTLEEYQALVRRNFAPSDSDPPVLKGNDLDVILDITAEDANILLPSGIYDADEYVKLHVDSADIDLRVNNYYLELMVNSSPLELCYKARIASVTADQPNSFDISGTQLFIDGARVSGHRLFGFGPSEPPYVSNWDVDAGSIHGEFSPGFIEKIVGAAQSFILGIGDSENAVPVPHFLALHDSTFVRFACPEIRLMCRMDNVAFQVSTASIGGNFNDHAGRLFSQRLNMTVPDIVLACLDATAAQRRADEQRAAETYAYLHTSLSLTMVQRSARFEVDRRLQQEHIQLHDDQRGHRVPFLIRDRQMPQDVVPKEPISLPLPSLPPPLVSLLGDGKLSTGSVTKETAMDGQFQHVRNMARPCPLEPSNSKLSIPLSSPFMIPHFPLSTLQPDLSDIPQLQPIPSTSESSEDADRGKPLFDDTFDEGTVHTTFLVKLQPGVAAYVRPEAVRSAACLMDRIRPRFPSQVLDSLQFSTIIAVLAKYSRKRGNNSITDIGIEIPETHVRFVNDFEVDSLVRSDRYELVASAFQASVRLKQLPNLKNEADATAVHTTLGRLKIHACEGSERPEKEDAAFEVNINDILVWLNDTDRTSVHASFQNAEMSMASEKVEYLAGLIHRTAMLANDFESRFVTIIKDQKQRIRHLIFLLTTIGDTMPDPPFLTRPSYVIRSSRDHVRNSDSWKIISKLRSTYRRLNDENRRKILSTSRDAHDPIPSDAETRVIATLDAWRSWDALKVKESFLIRIVYGSMGDVEKMNDRSKIPVSVSIRASLIKAVIDPGPKESIFSMDELGVALSISPPPPQAAIQLFQIYDEAHKTNILQVKTSRIGLQVNWTICDLVDQVITLFEEVAPPSRPIEIKALTESSTRKALQTFHIALSSGYTDFRLIAINATAEFAIMGMKASVTGSGWQADVSERSINTISTADALSLTVYGHERLLLRSKIIGPSLWVAHDMEMTSGTVQQSLKLAGHCKEVVLQSKDEILGLIEVVHALIKDEVAYLYRLVGAHEIITKPSLPNPPEANTKQIIIDLAFFLDLYSIEVAVMSDVLYSTVGRTIRLAIAPVSKSRSSYDVDFDLKGQTHKLISVSKDVKSSWELEMPAINGHIRGSVLQNRVSASAAVSMERITLEGSAVYGFISTLTSFAAVETFKAIAADARALKILINEVLEPPQMHEKPVKTQSDPMLNFEATATLAGFAISADAPAFKNSSPSSNLLFDVRSLHIRASNRAKGQDIPLPFLEFRVAFQELGFELRQAEHDALRLVGKLTLGALLTCEVGRELGAKVKRDFQLHVSGPGVDLGPATAPVMVEVLAHLQSRMNGLDLSHEKRYLRRLRHLDDHVPKAFKPTPENSNSDNGNEEESMFLTTFTFDLQNMRMSYIIGDSITKFASREPHDLVLSLENIQLLTRSQAEARLNIKNLQLGLVPTSDLSGLRPRSSALLPEVIFNVKNKLAKSDRQLSFQVAGQALDLQLDPGFILPANDLERSITFSSTRLRAALKLLRLSPSSGGMDAKRMLGSRKLSSLAVDADFAGALVHLEAPSRDDSRKLTLGNLRSQRGRYGQFAGEDSAANASLRAPGMALKVQYLDNGTSDPTLNIEVRVDGSNNVLNPSVVPLLLQISDSVKKLVKEENKDPEVIDVADTSRQSAAQPFDAEQTIVKADPKAILGKTKLNIGVRICTQEFSLLCQPIAKVSATAKLEDIYITLNNVSSTETNQFFAATAMFKGLNASLQHAYSRTTTFSFEIESIVLSLMNSKHLSGSNGISAILKVNPTKTLLNAKQLQDVLLFREIWLPPEIRNSTQTAVAASASTSEPEEFLMHRYQQIAASTAFAWNASVAIANLTFELDLGQSIGKPSSSITNLWITSTKTSTSKQNLCIGVDEINISSSGRLSGFVVLQKVKVRTSIAWPKEGETNRAPLIQGSIGFDQLRVKAAFDYQAFAVADITSFEFIMYNVRDTKRMSGDRLVAILDGDQVSVHCIAATAALALSLVQAFERLVEEKKSSYEQSIRDIEKFLRRKSSVYPIRAAPKVATTLTRQSDGPARIPISLQTDVVVTLRSLDVGAFPASLLDNQILKFEASDVQARFTVVLEDGQIHSGLGMTLGQLRVALATVPHPSMPKQLGEISVEEVVGHARAARGGVILRVPKVVAAMQTWQAPESNNVDYIFRSSFEGKIDVGWNYSRISFIRGMYETHTRTLATRLGKPLPTPAVRIKGAPEPPPVGGEEPSGPSEPPKAQKITAEVTLPQSSKYTYRALEPPIIVTPQLRDMGEATPPLEWVGLHRDRLPNVTHQIVIVTLLEIAKEVEDAYSRILGSA